MDYFLISPLTDSTINLINKIYYLYKKKVRIYCIIRIYNNFSSYIIVHIILY